MVLRQILKILLVTGSIWFDVALIARATELHSQHIQNESAFAKVLRDFRRIREIPRLGEVEFPSTRHDFVGVVTPTFLRRRSFV